MKLSRVPLPAEPRAALTRGRGVGSSIIGAMRIADRMGRLGTESAFEVLARASSCKLGLSRLCDALVPEYKAAMGEEPVAEIIESRKPPTKIPQ